MIPTCPSPARTASNRLGWRSGEQVTSSPRPVTTCKSRTWSPHHTQSRGRAADAADRQRAADRQVEVVGEHGRGAPVGQRGLDHLAPGRPGVDHHPVALDSVNGPEPSHVGHDAVARLGAAEHRVPPPLGREPAALPGGPADRGRHVLGRRGDQDGLGQLVHQVPEVIGRGHPGVHPRPGPRIRPQGLNTARTIATSSAVGDTIGGKIRLPTPSAPGRPASNWRACSA